MKVKYSLMRGRSEAVADLYKSREIIEYLWMDDGRESIIVVKHD